MIWIAFFVWIIIWLLFYIKNEYLWRKLEFFYKTVTHDTSRILEPFNNYCDCPSAFQVDQRYNDGKNCIGIKGQNMYPLPIKCCLPFNYCSTRIPQYFPEKIHKWDAKSWANPPTNKQRDIDIDIKPEQPTLRDLTGIGPRSYWCYDGQTSTGEPKCERYLESPLHPSRNQCGHSMISQMPNTVFVSKNECKVQSNACFELEYDKCMTKSECGWCEELSGVGSCKKGTPEGPLDVTLTCTPSTSLASGAWTPSSSGGYIIEEQSSANDIWEYDPESLPMTWKTN